MGMSAILLSSADPVERAVNTLLTEVPVRNPVSIGQTVSGKKFKTYVQILFREPAVDNW